MTNTWKHTVKENVKFFDEILAFHGRSAYCFERKNANDLYKKAIDELNRYANPEDAARHWQTYKFYFSLDFLVFFWRI